jgi:hypothetical protein
MIAILGVATIIEGRSIPNNNPRRRIELARFTTFHL